MTTETTTLRVWVACLAAYNAGRLHGRWVDVTSDPDDLWAEIKQVLATSPEPGAEEFAFHDYEGFSPLRISEYEGVERVCKIAAGVEEHGQAFLAYLSEVNEDDIDGDEFSDRFRGTWDSEREYAEDYVDNVGLGNIPPGDSLEVPGNMFSGYAPKKINVLEELSSFLDWDAITRNVMEEHTSIKAPDYNVFIFGTY